VNGYDESRQVVEKFVKEKKLKQRVLLMGGAVARDLYLVRGFPTSLLVDREGKITDQEVGFGPGSAPGRESKLKALLEKERTAAPR
jgi:hypothetical protein